MRARTLAAAAAVAAVAALGLPAAAAAAESLVERVKGLTVAAERGGYPGQDALNINYDREEVLAANKANFPNCDGYYSRYDATCYQSEDAVDIDHRVSVKEAWNSGLRGEAAWESFDGDRSNLNVMTSDLNRHEKSAKDAAEWVPEHATCHYVRHYVATKTEYGLTVDQAERSALLELARGCTGGTQPPKDTQDEQTPPPSGDRAPSGDVDCDAFTYQEDAQRVLEARAGDPYRLDGDGDGRACESLPRRPQPTQAPDTPSQPTHEPTPTHEPEPSPTVDTDVDQDDTDQVTTVPEGGVQTGGGGMAAVVSAR